MHSIDLPLINGIHLCQGVGINYTQSPLMWYTHPTIVRSKVEEGEPFRKWLGVGSQRLALASVLPFLLTCSLFLGPLVTIVMMVYVRMSNEVGDQRAFVSPPLSSSRCTCCYFDQRLEVTILVTFRLHLTAAPSVELTKCRGMSRRG